MEHNGSRSFWDEHKGIPAGLSRRGFIQRMSLTTLGVCAIVAGASRVAAYADVRRNNPGALTPASCAISCTLLECKGCACGGDLYHCSGCGMSYKKCFPGEKCKRTFCDAPVCN
jgi:hypothetical protein